jgi:hypothetical protein
MSLHQLDKRLTSLHEKVDGKSLNFLPTTHGSCITTMQLLTRYCLWEILAGKQMTVLEHPPCSPDLASNDFCMFPKIKGSIERKAF